jgi:hypothetical protein
MAQQHTLTVWSVRCTNSTVSIHVGFTTADTTQTNRVSCLRSETLATFTCNRVLIVRTGTIQSTFHPQQQQQIIPTASTDRLPAWRRLLEPADGLMF